MPGKAGADNVKSRRYNVYRNGDQLFRPVQWTYSNRYYKSWDRLCEDLQEKVPERQNQYGRGGIGIKVLYSDDGKTKIKTLEELENYKGENLVIAGPEPYRNVPGGYKSIPPRTPVPPRADKGNEREEESYRDKNKKKYGDVERSEDQKIHNRTDPGTTKRFTVYKNGDEKFKPKLYIWRSKQTPTWEKMLEDLHRMVGTQTGGPVQHIYTLDGNQELEDFEDIEEGGHYVVAEEEFEEVHGGYDGEGSGGKDGDPSEDPDKRDEEFWEKDQEMLRKHKEKMAGERKEKDKIYNRKDQIYTEPIFIHAFRNGSGSEPQRYVFTPKQLDRGMPWLLEQVAKKFNVNPKRLSTMDGKTVPTVADLVNRGSYVLIPLGEKFRDTWYYLPEGAIDTSEDADEEENERQGRYNSRSPNPSNRGGSQERNRSRSRSQDSRTESDRDDGRSYDEYNTAYDDEDNNSYDRGNSRGRSKNKQSHTPRGQHSHSADSNCSYCQLIQEHKRKHDMKHHTPRGSANNSRSPSTSGRRPSTGQSTNSDVSRYNDREKKREQDDRNKRNKQNSRSISPADRRKQSTSTKAGSNSIRSNSTDSRRKGGNQLTPNYNRGANSSKSRQSSKSAKSRGSTMTRSNSDASLFHAKSRQSGRPSTVNYDRDSSGKYRAQSGRVETRGAKPIRDSKNTKTELPIDRRKAREVPETRSAASTRTDISRRSQQTNKTKSAASSKPGQSRSPSGQSNNSSYSRNRTTATRNAKSGKSQRSVVCDYRR